ncbi:MAG: radical SAM protein [Bacteroidota bacterium]
METMMSKRVKAMNTARMNIIIETRMVLHSIGLVVRGSLKPGHFFRYLKRLLIFIQKMDGNKYVKLSTGVKINLYVPAFPSRAFFNATHKMLAFDTKMPAITALISVTSACRYDCEHCYQKLDRGKDVDLGLLLDAVKYFQKHGVSFFNVEGGEPFLTFPRLKAVCEAIDDRSEVLINSTGESMNEEKLLELKRACNLVGVMFSLHTSDEDKFNQFMRNDRAFKNLVTGINICHQHDVSVMFNTCLLRDAYYNGEFEKLLDRARELGGSLIQLIKPKSAGGWLLEGAEHFSKEDLEHIKKKVIRYNTHKEYRSYPFISAMIIDEDEQHFGCTAGGTDRFYLNAKGDLQACEFLNLSFGNIAEEPIEEIFQRMRKSFEKPGSNWLCEVYHKKIADKFREMDDATLPLPFHTTNEIINTEDHGKVPDFYERVNKI